ncbi:hypothetical protein DPMN_065602 [Dreissena polymorpha]|uniref:Uncharacterized protein n=1 Tax=Dreissena polymorpha TaxID=45954 RepID=A0A9D4BS71_DREPO|nr:hypothetical protein DPMN_065602 [Dreissena polymorpha]
MPKHFQDMATDGRTERRTDGKTDGQTYGQRQNNIPPPMAGDNKHNNAPSKFGCVRGRSGPWWVQGKALLGGPGWAKPPLRSRVVLTSNALTTTSRACQALCTFIKVPSYNAIRVHSFYVIRMGIAGRNAIQKNALMQGGGEHEKHVCIYSASILVDIKCSEKRINVQKEGYIRINRKV